MLSVITAIHNGIAVNRLFLKSLKQHTRMPYELIIVDNHSTDGSAELFEEAGAIVIRNPENHCYPESQNMGMARARGEWLAFLNNDIVLAPGWDAEAIRAMQQHGLDLVGLGSFEVLEDPVRRRKFGQRWKWLRRGNRHVRMDSENLEKLMNKLYGRQGFTAWAQAERTHQDGRVYPGLNGSALVTTRRLWEQLGEWDVRMEAADWHLHMLVKKRAEKTGDIRPPAIAASALHHHFARLTFHANPEPRACNHEHLSLQDVWTEDEIRKYGPSLPEDTSWRAKLRKAIKRFRIDLRHTNREKINEERP